MADNVDRMEAILDRLEWLVKASDGKEQIGADDSAELREMDRLVDEYERLKADTGAVFVPKLGRFRG